MYLLNNEIQQLKEKLTMGKASKWSSISGENMKEYKFDRSKGAIQMKRTLWAREWAWGKNISTFRDKHANLLAEIVPLSIYFQ